MIICLVITDPGIFPVCDTGQAGELPPASLSLRLSRCLCSVVATVAGGPAELEDSISSVLASLQERSPARPRIITKADFLPSSRHQKAGLLDLPPEFTVSTDLTVSQPDLQQADNSR